MIIRAGALLTLDGPPVAGGELRVSGNRIANVGAKGSLPQTDGAEEVIDLGDHIVLPGLINAHCHLDYTMMRSAIAPPASFSAWVQRINAIKRSLDSDDYLAAIARGFSELKRWGTTTVCNIEAFPELMPRMPAPPIRTWWFYEMIDIRHRITTDEVVAGALMFFQRRDETAGGFGLSPHAPYTASTMLYHLANDCAGTLEMPLMTHVAESREELEMFRDGRGPLYDFMASLRRPMHDCGGGNTPFGQLWKSHSIDANWLLTHMNELTEDDFALLAELPIGGAPNVVHCPGSHRYFRHSPFPYRRLHGLGVNICVGTDSLASNDSLSLLSELRRLQRAEPWLDASQLLRTVTVNPARALRRENQLGRITAGALADLIAIPFSHKMETIYEEVVAFAQAVPWMMIDGKIR
jgi:cytosine/adenosine deaminase-related metal-dependent hydrolase